MAIEYQGNQMRTPEPAHHFRPLPSAAGIRLGIAAASLVLAGALAPHWIAFAQRPEFDVASVKVSDQNQDFGFTPRRVGNRVSIHMTHIATVITYAYHIPYYQMINYDKSPIAYEWYDIDAKMSSDATEDQVRLMFQSLLEERFQLKVHREERELPEYLLTVAKGKSKMTPASSGETMKYDIHGRQGTWPKGRCADTAWKDGSRIICHAASMGEIDSSIRAELKAPLSDQTGLTGTYDLILHFIPDRMLLRPDAEPGPSLESALKAELGLNLEKRKGPVEVLVIDRLAKPSDN